MRTNSLFVDTSGWMAITLDSDTSHLLATQEWSNALNNPAIMVYTTDHVVAEVVALLTSRRMPRPHIIQAVDKILVPPRIKKLYTDEALLQDSWELLRNRQDKNWSLVDAVSILRMQQLGITEALTNDHHFEQAGFVRLLK